MTYKGVLFGRVGGKYIPLSENTEYVEKLESQRDELLAALKEVLDPESDMDAAFKKAYDAIHRVENA